MFPGGAEQPADFIAFPRPTQDTMDEEARLGREEPAADDANLPQVGPAAIEDIITAAMDHVAAQQEPSEMAPEPSLVPDSEEAIEAAIRHQCGTCDRAPRCEWCRLTQTAARTLAMRAKPRRPPPAAAEPCYISIPEHGPPSPPTTVWKSPAHIPTDDPTASSSPAAAEP